MICLLCSSMQAHQYLLTMRRWRNLLANLRAVNQVAEDIENVIQIMADNKLSLNVSKRDFIIVSTRSKMRDLEETLCITVQSKSFCIAPFVKYLRCFTDENFDWGYHIDHGFKKFLQVYQF